MMNFKNILCPVDLSENSQYVVELASTLAKLNQATLVFAFVGPPPLPASAAYAEDEMNRLVEHYRERLQSIEPTEPDVDVKYVMLRGDAADEILRYSKEEPCDLIVLSTHGRSGIARFLMGSVAEKIFRSAQVPIMSVRQPNPIVGDETVTLESPEQDQKVN